MKKYGSADSAFSVLLAKQDDMPLKRGDFARMGNHILYVIEGEALGWVKARFIDDDFVMQAQASDLVRYEPTNAELLKWRLTQRVSGEELSQSPTHKEQGK